MRPDQEHDISDRELAELARELPWTPPDAASRQSLRDAIVLEAQTLGAIAAPSRTPWVAGAAIAAIALAAAIALVFLSRGDAGPARAGDSPPSTTVTHRATVQASSAADFVHSARLDQGINDEVVRLRGGRVSVSVARLAVDQRFRVVAGDGEVEVRGTAFDVTVVDDRLEAVVVAHGLVLVRLGKTTVEVAGGQQWTRADGVTKLALLTPPPSRDPAPAAVAATAPAAAPAPAVGSAPVAGSAPAAGSGAAPAAGSASGTVPARVPARVSGSASASVPAPAPVRASDSEPEPAPVSPPSDPAPSASPTEISFREGRLALRDGDFGSAADLFSRAIASDPDAPLAEDARYWRGVALVRAGRDSAARTAFAEFLAKHATSLHAGRASLMLGNLLVDSGDPDAARARFRAAESDADPDVRAAARKALAALGE